MSDDLTRIKDIGLAREKWLNDHGIASYAELARTDPIWLQEKLRDEGRPVPLALINGWIEAAAEKSRENAEKSSRATGSVIPFQKIARVPRTEDGWEEFASFYVSYQRKHEIGADLTRTQVSYRTYADHIEANENREWAGIEGEGLCQWVLNHVTKIVGKGQDLPIESDQLSWPASGGAAFSPTLAIRDVSVMDDRGHRSIGYPEQRFEGWVTRDRPLNIESEIVTRVPDDDGVVEKAYLNVVFSVHDLATGVRIAKSAMKATASRDRGMLHYRLGSHFMALTEGLYRVRIVASLSSRASVWTVADIPLLQVV